MIWYAILGVFVVTALSGMRAGVLRLLDAEEIMLRRRRQTELAFLAWSKRLRAAARWSLHQKGELASIEAELEQLLVQKAEIEAAIQVAKRMPVSHRWVLEGAMRGIAKRIPVVIQTDNALRAFKRPQLPDWSIAAWKAGQTVLIGGASEPDVMRRALARWPKEAGFVITFPVSSVESGPPEVPSGENEPMSIS